MKHVNHIFTVEFVQKLIIYFLVVLEIFFITRVFLRAAAANESALFVRWVNGITYYPTLPFAGIFNNIFFQGSEIEVSTIFAMGIYAIAAFTLIAFVEMFKAPSKRRF